MRKIFNAGFTLLELLVVIAITGILSGVGIVNFNQTKQSTAVRLVAENFAGYLRTTESMTRSGTPFANGSSQQCDGDASHLTRTPCGGYGVVVRSDGTGYDRYADVSPRCVTPLVQGQSVVAPCTNSTPVNNPSDIVQDSVRFTDPIVITTGKGAQVEFVPPKDGICVYDPNMSADKTSCGPWKNKIIEWKFGYGPTGSNYQRTVTLNTVSGSIMVK